MKTTDQLSRLIARANMRAWAMEYRRALTWSLYDGDWQGRINHALACLDLAKTYRQQSK